MPLTNLVCLRLSLPSLLSLRLLITHFHTQLWSVWERERWCTLAGRQLHLIGSKRLIIIKHREIVAKAFLQLVHCLLVLDAQLCQVSPAFQDLLNGNISSWKALIINNRHVSLPEVAHLRRRGAHLFQLLHLLVNGPLELCLLCLQRMDASEHAGSRLSLASAAFCSGRHCLQHALTRLQGNLLLNLLLECFERTALALLVAKFFKFALSCFYLLVETGHQSHGLLQLAAPLEQRVRRQGLLAQLWALTTCLLAARSCVHVQATAQSCQPHVCTHAARSRAPHEP
mmetsp:Transcript_78917/g.115576  ORF Transcript_78917/g.115576 Transcript_78917/m.115576 type:complete len:285 (-) Transcript_78917:255-1109(-)